MVDWRTYKITSRSINSNYIRFYLDDHVNYSGGSEKRVDTKIYSPFTGWQEGDYIEIDNDQTRYKSSGHEYTNNTYVRFTNCHHGCGHSHKEYDDLKEKYDKLERDNNDLTNDRDNWRKKYDELKDQLNNEKIRSANELASEKLSRQNTESTLRNEKNKSGWKIRKC